jgi:hypothetical protein
MTVVSPEDPDRTELLLEPDEFSEELVRTHQGRPILV